MPEVSGMVFMVKRAMQSSDFLSSSDLTIKRKKNVTKHIFVEELYAFDCKFFLL